MSLTNKIKEEVVKNDSLRENALDLACLSLLISGHFVSDSVSFSINFTPYINFMQSALNSQLSLNAETFRGRQSSKLLISGKANMEKLKAHVSERFSYDFKKSKITIDSEILSFDEKSLMLRALFLSAASISDPLKSYHLEFTVRRISMAEFYFSILESIHINAGLLRRYGANVIYIKEGNGIGDFLAAIGASSARLAFENQRIENELRSRVNRVVNCDEANARRIAASAARQIKLISELESEGLMSQLSDELKATAELRINNPELSIGDLASASGENIGKSGMYHRLKKFETEAEKILALKAEI